MSHFTSNRAQRYATSATIRWECRNYRERLIRGDPGVSCCAPNLCSLSLCRTSRPLVRQGRICQQIAQQRSTAACALAYVLSRQRTKQAAPRLDFGPSLMAHRTKAWGRLRVLQWRCLTFISTTLTPQSPPGKGQRCHVLTAALPSVKTSPRLQQLLVH